MWIMFDNRPVNMAMAYGLTLNITRDVDPAKHSVDIHHGRHTKREFFTDSDEATYRYCQILEWLDVKDR